MPCTRPQFIAPRLLLALASLLTCLASACGSKDTSNGDKMPHAGSAGTAPSFGVPDHIAGKTCTKDADCKRGRCLTEFQGNALLGQATLQAPGGYCSGECRVASDCGVGGTCIQDLTGLLGGMAMNGLCYASCASSSECRDGYYCIDALGQPLTAAATSGGAAGAPAAATGSCQVAPMTNKLRGDVVGQACGGDSDCGGGRCITSDVLMTNYPGGYCSGSCLQDADCGSAGTCSPGVLGNAGTCYRACSADSDCTREGYRCRSSVTTSQKQCLPGSKPLADGVVGLACSNDTDCGGGAMTCVTQSMGAFGMPATSWPQGYCTQRCVDASDCGAGATCSGGFGAAIGTFATGTCYKTCSAGSDCREGYTCSAPTGGFGAMMASGTVCRPAPAMMGEDAGVP